MKYLFDTHILLWVFANDEKLPDYVRSILSNRRHEIFYSAASAIEVAIKHAKHPNILHMDADDLINNCERAGYQHLPIVAEHAAALKTLRQREDAQEHKDPFDRTLLAQAKVEGMVLLTHDQAFEGYDEPNVWIV